MEFVLDGAHNEPAMTRLAHTWREVYGGEPPVLVLGILRDKDVRAICRAASAIGPALVIATPLQSPRSCTGPELAGAVGEGMPGTPCVPVGNAQEALTLAAAKAERNGTRVVLVAGSLFLVGEVTAILKGGVAERSSQ